jgi:hypothetical protein
MTTGESGEKEAHRLLVSSSASYSAEYNLSN